MALLRQLSVAVVVVVVLSCALQRGSAEPTTEYQTNPLGVQATVPRLSWVVSEPVPGSSSVYQAAYQIQVASSSAFHASTLLWDTGRVVSNNSVAIEYGGATLASGQRVWWRVALWTELPDTPCSWAPASYAPPSGVATAHRGAYGSPQADIEVGWWEMALLAPSDWAGATWISRTGGPGPSPTNSCAFYHLPPAPLLRTTFALKPSTQGHGTGGSGGPTGIGGVDRQGPERGHDATPAAVVRARVYVSGLGYYRLYLDGTRVGQDVELDPGWTTYSKRVLYSVYNVTQLLADSAGGSTHALGVELGNGWWNPLPLLFWGSINLRSNLPVGWEPMVIALLVVDFADGSRQVVGTQPDTWRVASGPVTFNNIYLGEHYDARREVPGWTLPTFNDSGWTPAVASPSTVGRLHAQPVPPIRRQQELECKQVWSVATASGVGYVFDLGRNFAGVASLRVKGAAGAVVTLQYGELLWPNGTVDVLTAVAGQIKKAGEGGPCSPAIALQQDKYTLKGDPGGEVFTPAFVWHGFRYVQVTGWPGASPPTPDAMTGWAMYSSVDEAGTFVSSNTLLNRIHAMARHSHTSNMMSVQSDCPTRERFGYGGDVLASAETALWNWRLPNFYEKRVTDFGDAQEASGGYTETAPFVGIVSNGLGGKSGPIGWDTLPPVLQVWLYQWYGSTRIMEQQYEATTAWIKFLDAAPESAVLDGLSDWMGVEPSPVGLTGLAFKYLNYVAYADISQLLGQTATASQYRTMAAAQANRLNTMFLNASTGVYTDSLHQPPKWNGTQCAQSLPLYYGLSPSATAASRTLEALVAHIGSSTCDGHMTTGMFGIKWLLMSLSAAGRNDLAFHMLNTTSYPSYGYMLDHNATTLWESWFYSDNVYSHNHAMFSSAAVWMTRALGGIAPHVPTFTLGTQPDDIAAGAGFARFVIAPRPPLDPITGAPLVRSVNATYASVRGVIGSAWTVTDAGAYTLRTRVPPNTRATIHVPSRSECGPHAVGAVRCAAACWDLMPGYDGGQAPCFCRPLPIRGTPVQEARTPPATAARAGAVGVDHDVQHQYPASTPVSQNNVGDVGQQSTPRVGALASSRASRRGSREGLPLAPLSWCTYEVGSGSYVFTATIG